MQFLKPLALAWFAIVVACVGWGTLCLGANDLLGIFLFAAWPALVTVTIAGTAQMIQRRASYRATFAIAALIGGMSCCLIWLWCLADALAAC
jgi:hypothetical protein